MNTPIIWVLLPGIAATLLFIFRRWAPAIYIAGILTAVFLAYLAWTLPIGEPISLLPWPRLPSVRIEDTFIVLGRRFILGNSARPALVLIYLGIALWFGGAYIARVNNMFIPLGLVIASLLTASLAVEPFLYSALLILGVALASVPILSPPGKPVGHGVLRFLKFQTIGVPFILIGGRLLSDLEIDPSDTLLALRVTVMIGLGFALIAAIFPFHTWIPMVAGESHPYAAAFVFFLLPATVSFLAVDYVDRYASLGVSIQIAGALRFLGILMVLTGGLWAAFERHLSRIMGFGAIFEIGMALLALSLAAGRTEITPIQGIYFAQFLPRALGLAIWALALCILSDKTKDLTFDAVAGIAHKMPIVAASVIIATFSIAGFPFLAGFPVNTALWSTLAHVSPGLAILTIVGASGLIIAGLRTLGALVIDPEIREWQITEKIPQIILLTLGWVMLLIIGVLPQLSIPALTNMALIFISTPP